MPETRHPIITFHGTNPTAVDSILENGYVIPGSTNLDGKVVKVVHGSSYGVGIYTSPFFDMAMSYANRTGNDQCVKVLINLVFLGKMKLVPPIGDRSTFKPVNGCHADGFNTKIVYGLQQLVSADPLRVFPVAVMRIRVKK